MKTELDTLLYHSYPEIFLDRHGDPTETGMCWGFQCGDGWFPIIDELCADITRRVKDGTMPPVIASQVKEKFGHFRFYIRDHFNRVANPEVHRLIKLAQLRARKTCHICGEPIAWEIGNGSGGNDHSC